MDSTEPAPPPALSEPYNPHLLPAWASSQETGIPSPGPSPLGDMSQQVPAQQEAGSGVWGQSLSVVTPLQALLQACLPTGLSTPGGQEEPLLPLDQDHKAGVGGDQKARANPNKLLDKPNCK